MEDLGASGRLNPSLAEFDGDPSEAAFHPIPSIAPHET